MYYLICEGSPDGKFNASSKARNDAEKIIASEGFEKVFIKTKYGVQKSKIKKVFQYLTYIENNLIWRNSLKKFKTDDVFIFQYPLLNTTFNFNKILKKYSSKYKFVALIHDMDSLRYNKETTSSNSLKRFKKEDKEILNSCDYIISHNFSMTEELVKLGNSREKIVNLELFDYLYDNKIEKNYNKNNPIVIAGNLSPKKTKYLGELNKIKEISFNLYGLGYEEQNFPNVKYNGAFPPEELLQKLDGAFGLVWDGDSVDLCSGPYGNYLRFNNPHKASMYISAEMPIIAWKESAVAKIVQEKNIGIAVNNLNEIKDCLNNITEEEYKIMTENVKVLSKQIRSGSFLKNALKKIKSKI